MENLFDKLYRQIELQTKSGFWFYNCEDHTSFWSKGIHDIYAVPHNTPTDQYLDLTHQAYGPEASTILKIFAQCQEDGTAWDNEFPFTSLDGKKLVVRSRGSRLTYENKRMIVGTLHDITDFVHEREQFRTNSAFLSSIIDNIPHMVFAKEAEKLRFVLMNKAGEALLGVQRQDLIGKNDYDFFSKEQADFFTDNDRKVLKSTYPIEISEEPIDTPHGKRFLNTKKLRVLDNTGDPKYLLGISEDVTAARAARLAIQRRDEALEVSARLSALGQMAGGIAHEINNPLAIIRATGTQIRNAIERDRVNNLDLDKLAKRIETTIDRIAVIVDGLRDFSRDGSSDSSEVVSLQELIDDALGLCREKFKGSGIEIIYDKPEKPVRVCVQKVKLSQVFINLLNNAFDAMKNSTEKIVSIHIESSERFASVEITDSGPGIPEEIRHAVFDPFFTTKPVGEGTGLGLSISSTTIKDLGGKLKLVQRDKGASFLVMLPLIDFDKVA